MSEEETTPRDQMRRSVQELRQEMRAGRKEVVAALARMEAAILGAMKRRNDSLDALDKAIDSLKVRVTKLENPGPPAA